MKYNKYTQTYEVCFGDLSEKRQNMILELRLSKAKENYNFLYDCLEEIKANMEHINKILELLIIFKDKDNTQTITELEELTYKLYTAIIYATQEKDYLQDRENLKDSDKETLNNLNCTNTKALRRRIATLDCLKKEIDLDKELDCLKKEIDLDKELEEIEKENS